MTTHQLKSNHVLFCILRNYNIALPKKLKKVFNNEEPADLINSNMRLLL